MPVFFSFFFYCGRSADAAFNYGHLSNLNKIFPLIRRAMETTLELFATLSAQFCNIVLGSL